MNKTYVITGGTSGIGKALIEALSKSNKIFAGYRNEKFVDELKSKGTIPFYIDMENENSIENAANFIKSQTDSIDTIINVAGCVIAGVIENLPVQNIKKQFEVNTFSHLDFTQKLIPILNNGKIINISSMSSFGIFPFIAPYCASKRALDILFNAMSIESNIKVVSVKPGVIATPLWEKSIALNQNAIETSKDYEKEMKYMVKNAQKNGTQGLDVNKVANKILKIDKMTNPKPSYTIGLDAKFAEIASKLPFDIQNKLVKLGMKYKIK